MTLYHSNGFDIAKFLNVADRDRSGFWEVLNTGEFYYRYYIEEQWNRISDANYHFEAGQLFDSDA